MTSHLPRGDKYQFRLQFYDHLSQRNLILRHEKKTLVINRHIPHPEIFIFTQKKKEININNQNFDKILFIPKPYGKFTV